MNREDVLERDRRLIERERERERRVNRENVLERERHLSLSL